MIEPVKIGDATLYHADCMDVLPTLEGVDCVITDPPYGLKENAHRVASRGKLAPTTDYGDFEWDAKPASDEQIQAILSIGKQHIIWGGNYFNLPPARGWLVWDKINGANNFADCELAWTDLKMSVRMFKHMWSGMLRDSENKIPRVHPTQKPIILMEWCLGWFSQGVVCDPMMGSGSAGVAALRLGRKFIGIEIDEKYFKIACERIQKEADQGKLF